MRLSGGTLAAVAARGPSARVVLVVVALVAGALLSSCSSEPIEDADPPGTERQGPLRTGGTSIVGQPDAGSIAAGAQVSNGTELVIDGVVVAAPGAYAVVYADSGGAPGERLGSSAFLGPGDHRDVLVQLAEPLERDGNVWLMMHGETNGNQSLDHPAADAPLEGSDGVVVLPIVVTVEPPG